MKKLLLSSIIALAGAFPLASHAIGETFANGAVYDVVPYGNDPDVFCKTGMPSDGWVPLNPATGTWTAIRHYPNLYWVPTYQFVCPKAFITK